jgi:hypothetical protein
MSGSRDDTGLAWIGRAAGHLAGGAVGGALVWLLLSGLAGLRSPFPVVVVETALAVAAVGLPLWWVVLRPPRTGPWWGGLVAAWIPAAIVAALGLATAVAGDSTARRVPAMAALLYLASVPLTAVLAAVGAFLEVVLPRSVDF